MAKRKRIKAVEAHLATDTDGKPAGMVDVGMVVDAGDVFVAPPTGAAPARDPELYELKTYGGVTCWTATSKRAEQLRALYDEHVEHPERAEFGWKGACEATVPAAIADDVREAMDFMGSLVDDEGDAGGGKVRLFSEGYYAHGF